MPHPFKINFYKFYISSLPDWGCLKCLYTSYQAHVIELSQTGRLSEND